MREHKYKRVEYFDKYDRIMQFNKNKDTYIHGWYPFVEGYSKDFIRSIVEELDYTPTHCLEPFVGSGTTPLELQKLGIKCTSFEVSPFMHMLATTKMEVTYTTLDFLHNLNEIEAELENIYKENTKSILSPPDFKTIVEKPGLSKWNFDREVMNGILDIKYVISQINDIRYQNLFKVALASILLDVSNLYRNGKCLSYKKNWDKFTYSRREIHEKFLDKLSTVFYYDIVKLENYSSYKTLYSNKDNCILGDVRRNITIIEDNSIDLIITSPPYLNSRDYTDSYMIELRMLDFIKSYSDLRELRKKTLRSHVQVKWDEVEILDIDLLKESISDIQEHEDKFWNESLLNMIKGYFKDMDEIFGELYNKVIYGGTIFFNVANSAYYGVEIKTDEIISEIAERNGFVVKEIREARKINPSSQQKNNIDYLIESVIVIRKQAY